MRALLVSLAAALSSASAMAASESELRAALEQRFKGDRSGACIAAAVIENGTAARAYFCAGAKSERSINDRTAFEIGSITKTMTAALLAEIIGRGEIALDDPLAKLLPPGTNVPSFNGTPITLGNIVTHTSGLPSFQWRNTDLNNPYAGLTDVDLLGTLAKVQLKHAPGSQREYSNFALMVLSYALAKHSGSDFETLLRERLLSPLGMDDTYIVRCPPCVRAAQGHFSNGRPTGPWDVHVDLAGAGGVRATLPDMLRYLEGQLGMRDSPITPVLARTQEFVPSIDGQATGMAWETWSTENGRRLVMHPGGTGGFSAFFAFDRAAKHGVVLLSDTALTDVGGLRRFGMHLLDRSLSAGTPRTMATAEVKLIDALVGRYRLQFGLGMELRRKGNKLTIQADGEPECEMEYDSAGEFFPLEFDAVLRPRRKVDGTYTFTWFQLGGIHPAERLGAAAPVAVRPALTEAQLKEFEGLYLFSQTLGLRVYAPDLKLMVQGTGQAPQEAVPYSNDVFVTEPIGAEIAFERDAGGKVIALTLNTRGQALRGERH
ncbi:MAG TPA: serine hydrolase domain-containing protein [Steroidobacteraceae bacterium]